MASTAKVDMTFLGDISDLTGTLSDRVYESLRAAILSLKLAPGAVLHKGSICDQLGVSRSPVSEALARLSAEGLVEIIPQSATRVSRFSMEDIREAAFLREALELAAISKVATDRTEEQLAQLKRNIRMQELLVADKDYPSYFQADEEFHATLMSFTGFPRISSVVNLASIQLIRARRLLLPSPGRATDTLAEHRTIVDAIERRDPEAARSAMSQHLDQLLIRLEPLEIERPELFKAVNKKTTRRT